MEDNEKDDDNKEGINNLMEWANDWQMEFNVDKCHIMHLGSRNKEFKYTMEGEELKTSEFEKDRSSHSKELEAINAVREGSKNSQCGFSSDILGCLISGQDHFPKTFPYLREASFGVLCSSVVAMDTG